MRCLVVLVLGLAACAGTGDTQNHNGSGDGSGSGTPASSGRRLWLWLWLLCRKRRRWSSCSRSSETRGHRPWTTPRTIRLRSSRRSIRTSKASRQKTRSSSSARVIYQFTSTTGSEQQPQLDLYMTARAAFTGPFYPAMGNHECTGYTDSNCGTGNTDGVTKNLTAFTTTMLAPINQTKPYYVENFAAADNSLTAKFVYVACNARTTAQGTWLTQQLSRTHHHVHVRDPSRERRRYVGDQVRRQSN